MALRISPPADVIRSRRGLLFFHTFTGAVVPGDYPLAAASYGPNVSASFPIGWYAEDFDFLGDVVKPGTGGTYAYFIPIDTNGAPAFPYSIGRYWYSNNTGGEVR